MDIVKLSAYVLWAYLAACVAYKLQTFETPFSDSLSPEQKALMKQSGKVRGSFFMSVFVIALVVIYFYHEKK